MATRMATCRRDKGANKKKNRLGSTLAPWRSTQGNTKRKRRPTAAVGRVRVETRGWHHAQVCVDGRSCQHASVSGYKEGAPLQTRLVEAERAGLQGRPIGAEYEEEGQQGHAAREF